MFDFGNANDGQRQAISTTEQIIFLLGTHENICVVGDDDQGLYRFRGATIRNILEFPSKFDVGKCQIIPLVINYRSDSDIVEFYNKWMITTSGSKFKFEWDKFRYDKRIVANETSKIESPCVVKLASKDDEDEWHERVLDFINRLKNSGKIQDYNQLAFLFSSVKHERVISLARFLESNHINVYSPRSDMFFRREEVMQTLGCMMLMFPNYVKGLENGEYKFLDNTHYFYFRDCIKAANEFVTKPENLELKRFIRAHGKEHATLAANLSGTTDYTYSGLLYRLFMYKPFSDILDTDIGVGVVDIRPARNLAKLTQIIGKFEYLHNVDVLTGKYIIKDTELLFNMYIKLLFDGGIAEYEDDEEYAPTGCVSFLTIHQSKGMEFPIVFVDSLGNVPRKSYKDILNKIEGRYYHRETFEPYDEMKLFDFWRLYYTAFSRAQDLLVLTCNEDKKTPSKYIKEVYGELQSVEALDLSEFTFHTVKSVNLKNTFSFTSHIAVYETCALQYKFYKELEFMPIRQGAMLFGTLVHETIEDVHRAALRHEVFGNNNFVNEIIWKRKGGSSNPSKQLDVATDTILWYRKTELAIFNAQFSKDSPETQQYIEERFNNVDENGRRFMKSPIVSPNYRENLIYEYKGYTPPANGWSSGMKYVMYAGSVLMKQNVLEHPPVTYSDEPSPLLMVAEDPVPYGK